jgi:hypothetical protein
MNINELSSYDKDEHASAVRQTHISEEKALWLMVSIRDRALVGKHDTVGREYICLDPKRFGDFLVHDLWLNLDTSGRILLRVSMEGEKDDILLWTCFPIAEA